MSLLDDYPEIFCDECSIYPVVTGKVEGSTANTWPTGTTGLACSVQEAQFQEIAASLAVGVQINISVYFPKDPGVLPPNSKIVITKRNGNIMIPSKGYLVVRVDPETMGDFTVFKVDCTGRP